MQQTLDRTARADPAQSGSAAEEYAPSLAVLALICVIPYLLNTYLLFVSNINWDEFHYLAQVHAHQRGEPTGLLQTFHVHLFGWLTAIPGHEIEQITAARSVVAAMLLVSCVLIYVIARKFLSSTGAAFTVFYYLTFTNIARHGTSFRPDPLCALLFLLALCFFLSTYRHRSSVLAAGACMALSMMISVKSAFYLIVFALLVLPCLLSRDTRRRAVEDISAFGLSLGLFCGLLVVVHAGLLGPTAIDGSLHAAVVALGDAASKVLVFDPLVPRRAWIAYSLVENFFTWVLILVGLAVAVADVRSREKRKRGSALIAFGALLATVIIYRNSFPYFYVFLMPAPLILAGAAVDFLMSSPRASRRRTHLWTGLLILGAGLSYGRFVLDNVANTQSLQREIVALVHRLFPAPVAYIDRNSMIASFPKVGFFMSSWGIERYRETGRPIMLGLIREHEPKLLIANRELLDISDPEMPGKCGAAYYLLCEDYLTLKENYVRHWGAIYVPGKTIQVLPAETTVVFEILIPGQYTSEAPRRVTIDAIEIEPGGVMNLETGKHGIRSATEIRNVILRWGDELYRPEKEPATGPIYLWR